MARDRANINTAIWTSQEFRDLPAAQQRLYFVLTTHPKLSYVGVADWRVSRLAATAADTTAADIQQAAEGLQAARFVFIDEETEEILVRSFMRHDGLLKQPKLSVSMVNAYGEVASKEIREIVTFELQRLHAEYPKWAAFRQEKVMSLVRGKGTDMAAFSPAVCPPLSPSLRVTADQADPLPTSTATTTATSSKEDTSSSEVADATPRPEVQQLLDLLDARIAENGAKVPSRTKKNEDAARLLLDRDKHTVEQVEWMIRWATNDEFWRGNILSMSKLRDKFPQLLLKAGVNARDKHTGYDGKIDVDAILGKDYWSPPAPPAGLSLEDEKAWKSERRAEHRAKREQQARLKLEAQHG